MFVTETDIVTNHYLSDCGKKGTGSDQSHMRYDMINSLLCECDGVFTENQMRDALSSVSQGNLGSEYEITLWSTVYDKNQLTADYYVREDFGTPYRFDLKR